jgi:hypothetical protein
MTLVLERPRSRRHGWVIVAGWRNFSCILFPSLDGDRLDGVAKRDVGDNVYNRVGKSNLLPMDFQTGAPRMIILMLCLRGW